MTQKQVMGHLCRGSALTAESPAHGAERGDVRPRPLPSRGPSAHRALWSTPRREGRPAGSGRSLRQSTREDGRPDMAHTAHRPGRLIFGSDTWTGLAQLGRAGILIIPVLQM